MNDKSFIFSLVAGNENRKDLELRINAYEHRIQQIIDRATIQNIKIIDHILKVTDDPDELEMLSKAFEKLAKIMPEFKDLNRRKQIFEAIEQDQDWVMATFGDFSKEVAMLESITREAKDNDS